MNSLSRFRFHILSVTLAISLLFSSCNTRSNFFTPDWLEWNYTDLRLLDPVDSSNPNMDFAALYTRHRGAEFQVRLDLLDLSQENPFDLVLAIDTQPGGNLAIPGKYLESGIAWEILLETNSNSEMEIHTSSLELNMDRLRVLRNPDEDTLIITFSSNSFQMKVENIASIAAWIFPPGEVEPIDTIGPVNLFAAPPKPVPVVLYFWNLFEAATPAQALRRWDGAHSGPDSARHGLAHLINAVEKSHLPVILSDLNTPQNLSALDYLGVLDRIRQQAAAGLISVPELSTINLSSQPVINVPDEIYEKGLAWTSQVSQKFSIPNIQALVAQQWPSSLSFSSRYRFVFPAHISPLSTARICSYGQVRVLCQISPAGKQDTLGPYSQVTEKGLTLDVKKSLVNSAYLGDGSILFLGGDFGLSAWGNQSYSSTALEYLHSHPWIRVLSVSDLQTWTLNLDHGQLARPQAAEYFEPFVPESNSGLPQPSGLNTEEIHTKVLEELSSLPEGPLTSSAWQWYFELLSAKSDKQHRLNSATIGQIGHLIAGVKWSLNPGRQTGCDYDLDWDGEDECVLSSDHFFASFEPNEAAIVIGLLRIQEGVQQIIAPTYQVYSGISDPFLWEAEKGFLGDPDAVGGAFIERANVGGLYEVGVVWDDFIEFVYKDMSMRKTYTLSNSSLVVNYQSSNTIIVSGMLVNDPSDRFYPQWAIKYTSSPLIKQPDEYAFTLSDIRLTTNAELNSSLFTSSLEYLNLPEDPNFDYTAGHHQLFPFGSFTITGRNNFWIRIDWPE